MYETGTKSLQEDDSEPFTFPLTDQDSADFLVQ